MMGSMQVGLDIESEDVGWVVHFCVTLDRHEDSELFALGDKLISWPTEDLVTVRVGEKLEQGDGGQQGAPMIRGTMFLSEIAAKQSGIRLVYEQEGQARRSARILEFQARHALGSA
jgi:hypothetical protein